MDEPKVSDHASAGGKARANSLSREDRQKIARNAAIARWEKVGRVPLPVATHGSPDKPLRIGPIEIQAYVLPDGTRVLAQRGLQSGIGLSESGGKGGERRITALMQRLADKGIDVRGLVVRTNSPIRFIPPHGGNPADGYDALILPDICAVLIDANQKGVLEPRLRRLAERAAILQHGFAVIGITALVDEATGYQDDRARDALTKILTAFVAKELRPYVKTFPSDYYREMYRLRNWAWPEEPSAQSRRSPLVGKLTDDLIYDRLAPNVKNTLKELVGRNESGKLKHKMFQRLTEDFGNPKLREHLASVITLMKASDKWEEFMKMMNRSLPKFTPLPLFDEKKN
jgi:hypothetical protein